jgi:carboxylate-amine ligase
VAVGLIRAAVCTAMESIKAGRPAPASHAGAVRAAHWQAARHGMAGRLTDPRCGRPHPAQQMLDDLVDTVRPALLAGAGAESVLAGLARLRADGAGAARQRRVIAQAGGIRSAIPKLAELTTAG